MLIIVQDHSTALEALKVKDLAHQKAVDSLNASHAKELDETHDRAVIAGESAHAKEVEQIQASHKKDIAALKKGIEESQKQMQADAEKRKVRNFQTLFPYAYYFNRQSMLQLLPILQR